MHEQKGAIQHSKYGRWLRREVALLCTNAKLSAKIVKPRNDNFLPPRSGELRTKVLVCVCVCVCDGQCINV